MRVQLWSESAVSCEGCGYGLDFGEDFFDGWGRIGFGFFFGFVGGCVFGLLAGAEFFHQEIGEAFGAFFGWGYLGDGGQRAQVWVEDEVFDERGFGCVVLLVAVVAAVAGGCDGARLLGESDGGDLEAVEEERRAFVVELVAGDAAENLGDGEADGVSVFERW